MKPSQMQRIRPMLMLALGSLTPPVIAESSGVTDANTAQSGNYPAIEILDTTTDILGRPLAYPECAAEIKAAIITMAPGETGREHQHLTPLFGYILEGEMAVDYAIAGGQRNADLPKDGRSGDGGRATDTSTTRVYRAGDALMEAMHVMHHGYNPTDAPVRLLAVYMNCAE